MQQQLRREIKIERITKIISGSLLLITIGFWAYYVYFWITYETSAEAYLNLIVPTITFIFSFLIWINTRDKRRLAERPSVDLLVATKTPVALLNWHDKVRKTKEVTRQYARSHATKNTLIKLGGDLADVAAGTYPLGDLSSRVAAMASSKKTLTSLSNEVANIFLFNPDDLLGSNITNSSGAQEISDFLLDDFGLDLLIDTISESSTDWIPFLKLFTSYAFASAYAWVVSISTTIYILEKRNLLTPEKKELFQIAKKMMGTKFFMFGSFKIFPKGFEEPNWDDLLEITKNSNADFLVSLISEIRKFYPDLGIEQIKNILASKEIPAKVIEDALSEENWKKSAPVSPTLRQSVYSVIRDFINIR